MMADDEGREEEDKDKIHVSQIPSLSVSFLFTAFIFENICFAVDIGFLFNSS